jgi:transcriptional regulator with XRE-family HTH domain
LAYPAYAVNTKVVFALCRSIAQGKWIMSSMKDLRNKVGLSQVELAELAGTSQPQIHKLESGKLRLSKEWVERLAPHLRTEPMRLMFPDGKISIGFDERVFRLSKVNWFSSKEFDELVQVIDTVIRMAEDKNPLNRK